MKLLREDKIMKWMFIIMIAVALSLNGCADTADAEDSTTTTPVEQQEANERSDLASGDEIPKFFTLKDIEKKLGGLGEY
jgi:hypothetical protein